MPYPTIQGLVNDLASFYDDVNVTEFAIPGSKQGRYVHCVQLGIYEIWNYRPWYFKMAYEPISFSAGEATLPAHFANIGPNGALYDSNNRPWKEIAFQSMVRLRAAGGGSSKPARVFCVGTLQTVGLPNPGEGGLTVAYDRGLIIPYNENDLGLFTVYYETSPPQIVLDPPDLSVPIPLPESFHEPLLYAAVSKLQEFKGDPRDIWKSQYIAQLAKLAEIHYPLGSRMLQLPMTVGRGMW